MEEAPAAGVIDRAVEKIETAAQRYHDEVFSILSDKSTALELRRANNVLQQFERAFIVDSVGLLFVIK